MLSVKDFIKSFPFADKANESPWKITGSLSEIIKSSLNSLGADFIVNKDIAIHKSAVIENGVVLKSPIIICANVFIAANAYLRGGVYLGDFVSIGPGCEIKSSVICANSAIAHFNFIGDSIIGNHTNFEAGSLIANFHNDKTDKEIYVSYRSKIISTGVTKFGALVGDHSKIGANAVLSPGTILQPRTIVRRLQLVDQNSDIM